MRSNEKVLEYLAEMYRVLGKKHRDNTQLVLKLKECNLSQGAYNEIGQIVVGYELDIIELKLLYNALNKEGISYAKLASSDALEFEELGTALDRQQGIWDLIVSTLKPIREYIDNYTYIRNLVPVNNVAAKGKIESLFSEYRQSVTNSIAIDATTLCKSLQLIMDSFYLLYGDLLENVVGIIEKDLMDCRDIVNLTKESLGLKKVNYYGVEWVDAKYNLPKPDQLCKVIVSKDNIERFDVLSGSSEGNYTFQNWGVEKWRYLTYSELCEFINKVNNQR